MNTVQTRKASELTPDLQNANKGTERGRYAIEHSLREYGAGRSIVLDREGRVIAGNKTLETAGDVGIDDILVVQTDGTKLVAVQRMDLDLASDERARMLALADNRAGELSLDWDAEVLLAHLNEELPLDTLWREDELTELLDGLMEGDTEPGADTEPEMSRADELREQWQTQSGQFWQLGEHRLICGDCTDADVVARLMDGGRASIVFTSPPYNLGDNVKISNRPDVIKNSGTAYAGQEDSLARGEYFELLTGFTRACIDHCDYLLVNIQQLAGNKREFIRYCNHYVDRLADIAIWVKTNPQPAMATGVMSSAFEYILFLSSRDNPTRAISTAEFRGTFSNVYTSSVNNGEYADVHGATFPVMFAEHFISAFCPGICLEPFSGTGTTIIACENLRRQCRAIEISPAYVAVALERFHQHSGKLPVLLDASA